MYLAGLWLTDFRCYEEAELRFPPGVTVICGANAQGKTSLLEAVGWAATGKSFRGVADAALESSAGPVIFHACDGGPRAATPDDANFREATTVSPS